MKRISLFLIALAVSGCSLFYDQSKPDGYVKYCVHLLDSRALYSDSPEWSAKKQDILSRCYSSMDEAHDTVHEAAKVAGGKHSFLIAPVKDTASYPEFAPETSILPGNISYIKLPDHTGVKVSDSLYVHSVYDFLLGHADAKGVVLDLRGNTGGNMYPMIAAVSPLLPDGIILQFKGRKRTTPVSLQYVLKVARYPSGPVYKYPASTPVAILTDGMTASSGEATLLCFRGLENVKTFGSPSAGYASANVPYTLADGYSLVITQSCDMARTGEVFCDDPIQPDVQTSTPKEDAAAWILEEYLKKKVQSLFW